MNNEYTERIEKIEAALEQWLPENSRLKRIEEVFPGVGNSASLDALFAPVRDMLLRGGKRWRPLLMTLVCESLGGGDNSLPLSPLVEFSHNASLIHDDIEDNSAERRGKPAVHHIYGVDTAINSGSFLYFMSACCIEESTLNNKSGIYKLWTEYMRKLHLGQAMDIYWHREMSVIPGLDEYYTMCALKTGCLARFAAELGALAAGATQETARHLGEGAEKLGVGFQILDDVKNLTGDIPGKQRGDDIVEGKKSLPILLYLNKNPKQKIIIINAFNEAEMNGIRAPEVEELISLLSSSGVLNEAEETARNYIDEARAILSADGSNALLAGLIDLISRLPL